MKRRPEGWDNPNDPNIFSEELRMKQMSARKMTAWLRDTFEEGADALLEAQWKEGIPWPPHDSANGYIRWVSGAIEDTRILYGDVKGRMVFIPEEEKDD